MTEGKRQRETDTKRETGRHGGRDRDNGENRGWRSDERKQKSEEAEQKA
jgi:hypothetical protein